MYEYISKGQLRSCFDMYICSLGAVLICIYACRYVYMYNSIININSICISTLFVHIKGPILGYVAFCALIYICNYLGSYECIGIAVSTVCVYVYTYICTCIYVYICMYACMYISI